MNATATAPHASPAPSTEPPKCPDSDCILKVHPGDLHVLTASAGDGWDVTTLKWNGQPPTVEIMAKDVRTPAEAKALSVALAHAASAWACSARREQGA
jgi:hypothetical protein